MNAPTGSPGNQKAVANARRCNFCSAASLRRSRLRASDFPWLLVLHWPVRCRRCSKRQFVFLTYARKIIAATPPQNPDQLAQDSWQNFTTSESPALRSDRPGKDSEGVL